MAPLKSGHKIIVALHNPSDVPLLMNALFLPNDLMVSEYVTPPQPVKLMLNGVINPLLGPQTLSKLFLPQMKPVIFSHTLNDITKMEFQSQK